MDFKQQALFFFAVNDLSRVNSEDPRAISSIIPQKQPSKVF